MSGHTPGTWVMVTDSTGSPQHIKSEKYTTVCSFLTSVKRNCGVEELAGNARLIAAAPDLLDALKEIEKYMRADFDDMPMSSKARAAISKATGEAI